MLNLSRRNHWRNAYVEEYLTGRNGGISLAYLAGTTGGIAAYVEEYLARSTGGIAAYVEYPAIAVGDFSSSRFYEWRHAYVANAIGGTTPRRYPIRKLLKKGPLYVNSL